ncbi:hypothetical protein GGF32_009897 [Allomyces javanicus]|nr:hypothetical protein GGF32_009897 [Allomyces javanicus]
MSAKPDFAAIMAKQIRYCQTLEHLELAFNPDVVLILDAVLGQLLRNLPSPLRVMVVELWKPVDLTLDIDNPDEIIRFDLPSTLVDLTFRAPLTPDCIWPSYIFYQFLEALVKNEQIRPRQLSTTRIDWVDELSCNQMVTVLARSDSGSVNASFCHCMNVDTLLKTFALNSGSGRSLCVLDLSDNWLSMDRADLAMSYLVHMPNLTDLFLAGMGLTADSMIVFAGHAIPHLLHLEQLRLNRNPLFDDEFASLALPQLPALQRLFLRGNMAVKLVAELAVHMGDRDFFLDVGETVVTRRAMRPLLTAPCARKRVIHGGKQNAPMSWTIAPASHQASVDGQAGGELFVAGPNVVHFKPGYCWDP